MAVYLAVMTVVKMAASRVYSTAAMMVAWKDILSAASLACLLAELRADQTGFVKAERMVAWWVDWMVVAMVEEMAA